MVPIEIAVCRRKESGAAPCQCRSPGGIHAMSPARIGSLCPSRLTTKPDPAMHLQDLPDVVRVPVRP